MDVAIATETAASEALFSGTQLAVQAMCNRIYNFVREQDGTTAVEYAVMLALILGVIIGSITAFGSDEGEGWSNIANSLSAFGLGS